MASYQKQEAWKRISFWYRQASRSKSPLPRNHLDLVATERTDIYRCRPPEGLQVPIMVTLAEVDYGIPEGEEIERAVKGLKGEREDEPSGMQAEDLKGWLQEALWENNPVRRWWQFLVRRIQRRFEDGFVPEEVSWGTIVFLPKVREEYWGVRLVVGGLLRFEKNLF